MKRARPMEELLRDGHFPYHVGQLLGATEMAGHWMRTHDDPVVKELGAKLEEVASWFFLEDQSRRTPT